MIERARGFGLPEADIANAKEFLEHAEWGLCFEVLVDQLYEHAIPIDKDFLSLANEALAEMKINPVEYKFLNELIRSDL